MDREKFIAIYFKINNNSISLQELKQFYLEYCLEHNKKEEDFNLFFQMIYSLDMIGKTIVYPINYYKNKFSICTITNKESKIISIF